ncbi:MAG: shikimate dehydrogenase [Verrucomicrobia bacterium]|nr:shikimate dehydrogenase [Verrucomicrobiota bacterium]
MNLSPQGVYTLVDLRAWQQTVASLPPAHVPRFAVIGDPVAQSLSPVMHDAALAACGFSGRYTRLHIRAGELAETLSLLPGCGFLGCNLTIPHKSAALALVEEVDADARRLGAINTVRIEGDGQHPRRLGFNTDGPGLLLALRDALGFDTLRGKSVLLLGAGGAGRALAIQCALAGCARLLLANRTLEKAETLVREFSTANAELAVSALALPDAAWTDAPLDGIDLVLNCTSLGLRDTDRSPLPAELLRQFPALAIYDSVYRRDGQLTPLVAAAQAAGLRAADGRAMLLWQGALAFEIWFNQPAPIAPMRAALGLC